MTVKNLALAMGTHVRRQLGLEGCTTSADIKRALEPMVGSRFVFHKKGAWLYILVPCDPEDLVKAELSQDKPKGAAGIASVLPFSKADVSKILNHLLDTGEAKLILNSNLDTRIIATGKNAAKPVMLHSDSKTESESAPQSEAKSRHEHQVFTLSDYSDFTDAIRELAGGNYFARICDLRKKFSWPREVFDSMLRELRDKEIIQMHIADETIMTPDEVNNCFVDENNYRMGTVTLNAGY